MHTFSNSTPESKSGLNIEKTPLDAPLVDARVRRVYSPARVMLWVAVILALFSATASPNADAQNDDRLITPTGAGPAVIGSTVEDITEALGSSYQLSGREQVISGYEGHVVRMDGEVVFWAAGESGQDRLNLFIITSSEFQTAEGVGPGTTIAAAEAKYGQATLSFENGSSSREFVTFKDIADSNIRFRTAGSSNMKIGEYKDGADTTNKYKDDAEIASIWIQCELSQCPKAASTLTGGTSDSQGKDNADTNKDEGKDAEAKDSEDGKKAEPTPTPEPTVAPTAEPTPTPTPEPEPSETTSALPNTGANENLLLVLSAALVTVGGALVIKARRDY